QAGPGSVGVQVARHASCSLVVTRHDTDQATDGQLVVGVDGTRAAALAARFAFAEAARRRLPLHAVHACDPDLPQPDLHQWLRAHAGRYPGGRVTADVVQADAGPALLAAATRAALLMIGSPRHDGVHSA